MVLDLVCYGEEKDKPRHAGTLKPFPVLEVQIRAGAEKGKPVFSLIDTVI